MKYDVIVIGAGIAGVTCSIYLKRAGKKVLLIEKNAVGGLLNKCFDIQNYPGYPSIKGPDFAYNLYNQIKDNNIELVFEEVMKVTNNSLETNKNKYNFDYLVIASGRSPKKIIKKDLKTISYCGLCDGYLYKNKEVCVVGGGDTATTTSLFLAGICQKVNLLVRATKLKGDNELINSVIKKENINIIYNTSIEDVNEENKKTIITMSNKKKIESAALFVCIGFEPSSNIFACQKKDGYLVTDENMQTNIANIYAVGDIRYKDIYQLTTASGEGTIAASSIINRLNRK